MLGNHNIRLLNGEYVGGVKYQTLYSYDGVGNVLTLTYPDSYALTMNYDGVNRLKKVGGYATVGYTVDDKVSKIVYGNTEVTTYTYDSRDRPTRILDKYGSTKEMDLNYTYDGTGNVKTLNTETYRYDWLNRLNYSSGPWATITYAYDQVGNRIRMVQGTTTTYTYGAFNRLSSAGSNSYTYDANGNMITKTGGWIYSYDYENRLTKAIQSGTTVQQNLYDGNGNRIKQVAGSITFTYSYQGLNILYEKNVTGGTTTVTKHFYAGGLQVAKMVGSTTYYLHQDVLGSTRLVATTTVTVKFSSNYMPYGSNYAITGKEVFMYTGKPYDSVTGLYYEGARYYDQLTGRFITQDSVSGAKNDPLSLNRYIYARDNPMKIVDLNGHSGLDWITNGLSSVANSIIGGISTVTTAVTSDAVSTASAVSNSLNSMPPGERGAIVLTAAIAGAAVITVATAGVGSPLALAMIGAAASSGVYTAVAQSKATGLAALGASVAGGLSAGLGAGISGAGLGLASRAGLTYASNYGANVLGNVISDAGSRSPSINPIGVAIESSLSLVGSGSADEVLDSLHVNPDSTSAAMLKTTVDQAGDVLSAALERFVGSRIIAL